MIRRFDFGTPWPTDAVVQSLPTLSIRELPFFEVEQGAPAVRFTLSLLPGEPVLGLGQAVQGINKRGHRYRAWNLDDFNHTENKENLYGSHNLLLLPRREQPFGVFFDDPGEVTYDIGYTDADTLTIVSLNGNLSVYIVEAPDAPAIVSAFRQLIGESYLPPRWALGYIQSRWGYASEAELKHILESFRANQLPIDGLSMDIDYMDGYRDFTWNKEQFPDLKRLCREMAAEHVHLVPIIDAGIKLEPGDPTYDSGRAADVFCKKEDGSEFVGAVWPGHAVFPDFLRPEVRTWWARQHQAMLEAGLTAYWNDMNEPAIFYSREGMEEAYAKMDALRGKNLDVDATWALQGAVGGLANNRKDYERFYHTLNGRRVRHDKVHNLYGGSMTKASAQALREFEPDKRHLLFSRSSYIGSHREGGMWTGDNASWWSHLLLNLQMLPALNMCGFLYCGADLGGFGGDTTEELLLRWLQLGVFTPLMRNHSATGTREQEPYRFPRVAQMQQVLTVRYALIPYLYSQLVYAARENRMLFRPLGFDFPEDAQAWAVEDQLLWGVDCMIAPVYSPNATGRNVYLPEDMLLVRFRGAQDYDLKPMRAGWHHIRLATQEFALFIRRGHAIPLAPAFARNTEEIDTHRLTLLGWLDQSTEISLYEDDGETTVLDLSKNTRTLRICLTDGTAQCEGADASQILIGPQEEAQCPWMD